MTHYELMYILPGTLSEEEVLPVVEKVEGLLKEAGAASMENYDLGKTRLAYPMRHIRYGYFRLSRFTAEKTVVVEIRKKLNLLGDTLLRSVIQLYDPSLGIAPTIHQSVQQSKPGKKMVDPTIPESEAQVQKATPAPKKTEEQRVEEKVSMEEIDKELDKILDKEIESV